MAPLGTSAYCPSPAFLQSDPILKGRAMNLVRRFASVLIFVCILAAGALRSAAEPAIWVVKGSHATVYLFGTIHALDQNHPWHSAKIDAAIQQSQALWLEVPD